MGFWQQMKSWMSSEKAELKDVTDGLESRLDRGLSERERQLNETPSEAMERLQAESEASESMFGELGDKITGVQAKADAVAELADDAPTMAAEAETEAEIVIPESETEET